MDLYITEPPYSVRDHVKLPTPTAEEAQRFLDCALKHCFRKCLTSSWQMRELMGDDIPLSPSKLAEEYPGQGYDTMTYDLKAMTQDQYDRVLEKCSKAMYEQVVMSAVWNPVLTTAVRSVKKFDAGYVKKQIKDVFTPGAGNSLYRSYVAQMTDLEKSEDTWEILGSRLGAKLKAGVVVRARQPKAQLPVTMARVAKGVDPTKFDLITPEAVESFCPDCATEMRKKGLKVITSETLKKALDVEITAQLGDDAMFKALQALPDDYKQFAKSSGAGAIAGWAKRMKKEGGEHPFAWCQKAASEHGLGDAFCARVHLEAFGKTPTERKADKKGTKKSEPVETVDCVKAAPPIDWSDGDVLGDEVRALYPR